MMLFCNLLMAKPLCLALSVVYRKLSTKFELIICKSVFFAVLTMRFWKFEKCFGNNFGVGCAIQEKVVSLHSITSDKSR